MGRSLRTLVLALSVGTLLLGLCLPCANLLGSPGRPATGKSCCKKNGECQKVPSKDSSSRKPCPLQKAANATTYIAVGYPPIAIFHGMKDTTIPIEGSKRLVQLSKFIGVNGPISRRDIIAKSGLPEGTVGMLLNRKNFKKDDQGLWSLPEDAAK